MKIAIIQFPGSNCERETMLAVKRAGMEPIEFLWNESREKLQEMAGYIIVGGFSYEDRSRAGIIAALDPVMQEIALQAESGKPVLGICNGAQVLVETGMVPGLENNRVGMVLTENKRMENGKILGTGYYNAWVYLRLSDQYQRNAFTRHLTPKNILHVPVAHAEGRFVMTEALLQEVEQQGLNVFQYCDARGKIIDGFPTNPNGSVHNIAAISNKAGNVMAMMPHPERTRNGDALLASMRDYIAEGRVEAVLPLSFAPRRSKPPRYQLPASHHECTVELIITDNQALTVQNTLRQLGFPVTVKRKVHWEIQCDTHETLQQIRQSGVLYNERKERVMFNPPLPNPLPQQRTLGEREPEPDPLSLQQSLRLEPDSLSPRTNNSQQQTFLVRPREDLLGQQKLQTLKDHFSLSGVNAIYHGVLWQFTAENANIADLIDNVLHTNIISNPYAHECYQYNQ